MVHYLCYISSEKIALEENDLLEMLFEYRKKYEEHSITGILLYFEGHFVELIEGDKEIIRSAFRKTNADKRHKAVFKITESEAEERKFSSWSMAFPSLNRSKLGKVYSYKPFEIDTVLGEFEENDNHPGIVLLRSFMKQSKRKQLQYL